MASLVGLAGCPTVDLGDTPADIGSCLPDRAYYEATIWPDYIQRTAMPAKSCISMSGCHNDAMSARSGLRLMTNPVDHTANYRTITRRLNCGDPSASDLLNYPLQFLPHPIPVFGINDPEVTQVFLPWFDQ